MICCVWIRIFSCRRLLSFVLVSYLVVTLLFITNLDLGKQELVDGEESFSLIFPEPTFLTRRQSSPHGTANRSSHQLTKTITRREQSQNHLADSSKLMGDLGASESRNFKVQFLDPVPLSEPMIDIQIQKENAGDFIPIGKGTYIYSAFVDDRKEERYVRLLTLMARKASTLFVYCHFNESLDAEPRKSEHYELCENHNKNFGGYIFSCLIPNTLRTSNMTSVVISLTMYGPKVKLPVINVRPPEHKRAFLDSYPRSSYLTTYDKMKINLHQVPWTATLSKKTIIGVSTKAPLPRTPLSFAICVSPLFGNISVHRLVEFIELSLLLGAEHFIFYNHSVPGQVSDALQYYINQNLVTVLPWAFPSEVGTKVWYHGQLLANNDCLYRTMPHFDLVSFNDVDEFIVPHSNFTTWRDAFSSLLTHDRCGFSFQSAFYDPGTRESSESNLLTPVLTAKSQMFSKVRTKVMLCPWRVFEVGIHHISKQNREDWRPWGIEPSVAYLHHYRRCIMNFGMRCSIWEKDTIIADRYLEDLTTNFDAALQQIFYSQDGWADEPTRAPGVH